MKMEGIRLGFVLCEIWASVECKGSVSSKRAEVSASYLSQPQEQPACWAQTWPPQLDMVAVTAKAGLNIQSNSFSTT